MSLLIKDDRRTPIPMHISETNGNERVTGRVEFSGGSMRAWGNILQKGQGELVLLNDIVNHNVLIRHILRLLNRTIKAFF